MKLAITLLALLSIAFGADTSHGLTVSNLHPRFTAMDQTGEVVSSRDQQISISKTCGSCHDGAQIHQDSTHYNDKVKVECIQCHLGKDALKFDELEANGLIKESISSLIAKPQNRYCGQCHGLTHEQTAPLEIDNDSYLTENTYAWTRNTGIIFSPQNLDQSGLNLANKDQAHYPWDIHAQRQVRCTDCHFSGNNPRKAHLLGKGTASLDHLSFDPRSLDTSDYLKNPSHKLAVAPCTACHDPIAIHPNLAYKERHFAALSCQSCHIPKVMGPVVDSLDYSSLDPKLKPLAVFKNTDDNQKDGQPALNLSYINSWKPSLQRDESGKFAPFVTSVTYQWSDLQAKPIDLSLVEGVFRDLHRDRPTEFLNLFDGDRNGQLTAAEMRLDAKEKQQFIKALIEQVASKPVEVIGQEIRTPVTHGILNGGNVLRECTECHGATSRLIPAGFASDSLSPLPSQQPQDVKWQRQSRLSTGSYILGTAGGTWPDLVGLGVVAATILGIFTHSFLRYLARRKNGARASVKLKKVYMYRTYERLWHWLNSISITLLIVTGFELHFGGKTEIFGFRSAVFIHNVLAILLIVNGIFSLVYHLASKEIKQYLPPVSSFSEMALRQIQYYLSGIFQGEPHPLEKTPEKKLNPLQQVTYLVLLNFMIPLQIITGTLIWLHGQYPNWQSVLTNLAVLGPIHTLGSWLLLQFVILHVYLTTTGRTITSNIEAMVIGYEHIEEFTYDRE